MQQTKDLSIVSHAPPRKGDISRPYFIVRLGPTANLASPLTQGISERLGGAYPSYSPQFPGPQTVLVLLLLLLLAETHIRLGRCTHCVALLYTTSWMPGARDSRSGGRKPKTPSSTKKQSSKARIYPMALIRPRSTSTRGRWLRCARAMECRTDVCTCRSSHLPTGCWPSACDLYRAD